MTRIKLLGVEVDALTMDALQALVLKAAHEKRRWIIANHNLHSIYLFHHDARMRAFYEQAHRIHVDGMSVVFLAKVLNHPLNREHRVTYVDWIRPLLRLAAAEGLRVFYLGAKPGVAERGAEILRREIPALQIETHPGYFDGSAGALSAIRSFQPDILLVGMGMPRQEHWILDHWEELDHRVVLPAGACMDYVAGTLPTPPRWLGRIGLEWTYRLLAEPRRLARRYLIEPLFILRLVGRDVVLKVGPRRDLGQS